MSRVKKFVIEAAIPIEPGEGRAVEISLPPKQSKQKRRTELTFNVVTPIDLTLQLHVFAGTGDRFKRFFINAAANVPAREFYDATNTRAIITPWIEDFFDTVVAAIEHPRLAPVLFPVSDSATDPPFSEDSTQDLVHLNRGIATWKRQSWFKTATFRFSPIWVGETDEDD